MKLTQNVSTTLQEDRWGVGQNELRSVEGEDRIALERV